MPSACCRLVWQLMRELFGQGRASTRDEATAALLTLAVPLFRRIVQQALPPWLYLGRAE